MGKKLNLMKELSSIIKFFDQICVVECDFSNFFKYFQTIIVRETYLATVEIVYDLESCKKSHKENVERFFLIFKYIKCKVISKMHLLTHISDARL